MTAQAPTLTRLAQLADSLQQREQALALLALGSAGRERERFDQYSDLDFFVIARHGDKATLLNDLSWLTGLHPVGYAFRNTADGCKLLFDDGVFCEFAVFELAELAQIPFASGQVIWARPELDTARLVPDPQLARYQRNTDVDWQLGEALTNLYVGLGRYLRGEQLSAFRFVQQFAFDRLLDLLHLSETAGAGCVDPFTPDRRLEQRYPQAACSLPSMLGGYDQTPQSALAQLRWLQQRFSVNARIAAEIERLAGQATRTAR